MPLTIVVMAAGMGSRFGGPKQLEPVGPAGETLIDYLLFDARRAGFDHAVLVIRPELTDAINVIADRHRRALRVSLAYQRLAPAVPRGTVPAVLAAGDRIEGPFAALNADDFYGRTAYARAADFLQDHRVPADTHGVVTLPLHATLSPHGSVVRAVCATRGDEVVRVDEVRGIAAGPDGITAGDRCFTGLERVSVNFWALQRTILDEFEREFSDFARTHDAGTELLLPVLMDQLIAKGRIRVRLLEAPGPWLGLTHAEDLPGVRHALHEAAVRGDYPEPAWSGAAPRDVTRT
jgi:NDP-sugar pyrophosphorylase family protein